MNELEKIEKIEKEARAIEARSVGKMRQASALVASAEEIVIVGPRGRAHPDLPRLRVVRTYPDTTNAEGNWAPCFKIEVEVLP